MPKFSCQEYGHKFSRISGREIEISYFLQFARLHAGLFTDLASCTFFIWFFFGARARREFEQVLLRGMTILTNEKQIAIIVDGDEYNGTAMFNNFKSGFISLGSLEVITLDFEGASL